MSNIFTDRPWKVHTTIHESDELVYHIEPSMAYGDNLDDEEAKANAKLIAIAPDMYKFLSDLIKYPESIGPIQFMGLKEEAHKIIKGV